MVVPTATVILELALMRAKAPSIFALLMRGEAPAPPKSKIRGMGLVPVTGASESNRRVTECRLRRASSIGWAIVRGAATQDRTMESLESPVEEEI